MILGIKYKKKSLKKKLPVKKITQKSYKKIHRKKLIETFFTLPEKWTRIRSLVDLNN